MESTRKHPRISVSGEVQYVNGGAVVRGPLVDISRGGLCVEGLLAAAGDAPLKLFVTVSSADGRKRLWMLEAQPVWHRGDRHGLRFINVPVDVYADLIGLEGAQQDLAL